jgi:anti-sigma factor RsiW
MSDCEEYAALLGPFVDGELTDDECTRVGKHIASCPVCAEKVHFYRELEVAMKEEGDVPEPSPADWQNCWARVLDRAAEKTGAVVAMAPADELLRFTRRLIPVAAVLMVLFTLLALGTVWSDQGTLIAGEGLPGERPIPAEQIIFSKDRSPHDAIIGLVVYGEGEEF